MGDTSDPQAGLVIRSMQLNVFTNNRPVLDEHDAENVPRRRRRYGAFDYCMQNMNFWHYFRKEQSKKLTGNRRSKNKLEAATAVWAAWAAWAAWAKISACNRCIEFA